MNQSGIKNRSWKDRLDFSKQEFTDDSLLRRWIFWAEEIEQQSSQRNGRR